MDYKERKINDKLKIVISIGDESGIGPEIILKALSSQEIPKNIDILLVGSKHNLQLSYMKLKSLGIKNIIDPNNYEIKDINIPFDISKPQYSFGNASFHYLKKAIEIVKQSSFSALVTGPICKKSWHLAGHKYSGQTEVLAESCQVKNIGMLFTAKSPITGWRLNTLLATTHIALSDVPKKLTASLIQSKLDLLSTFCSKFSKHPNLRIAGLNPHAGEEGVIGNEEKNWINDAISVWKKQNQRVNIRGPIPPDTCWNSSVKAWKEKKADKHDGILAMYHDQGLIRMKLIALNYSVNTTLGLPFIRTSPDHGTAFDIAGKGIAQSQSMVEAIKTAVDLTTKSRLFNSH